MNVWKESFLNEICFLTRNDDLRKVAGNWTWPETGPHTVFCETKWNETKLKICILRNEMEGNEMK